MNAPYLGAVVLGAALLLSGCQPAPEQAEPVRPVLTKTLTLETAPASQFAGKIAPRYTTNLSFQTFGRVIERSVDVGDFVEPGQQIAQLDTTTQQLAIRTAEANLSSAQAQLNNLLAVQQSQRSLLDLGNISDAVFESAAQASSSGEAAVAQARAQLDKAKEQLGRATLRADTASLVTAVSVQPGQTVTVGQTVATVVRPESREAVIYVAEVEAGNLRVGVHDCQTTRPHNSGNRRHPRNCASGRPQRPHGGSSYCPERRHRCAQARLNDTGNTD